MSRLSSTTLAGRKHQAYLIVMLDIGGRARRAVQAACGVRDGLSDLVVKGVLDAITPERLETAADWLATGDRRAHVSRKWPMLAAKLRTLATEWRAEEAFRAGQ